MEEKLRRLNAEYGFELSEDEIKVIIRQTEKFARLFQPLYEVDLTHIMPLLKVDIKGGRGGKDRS